MTMGQAMTVLTLATNTLRRSSNKWSCTVSCSWKWLCV